jgi:hypothetical protein
MNKNSSNEKSSTNSQLLTGLLCAIGGMAAGVGAKLLYDELNSEKNPQDNQHINPNEKGKHLTNNNSHMEINSSNYFCNKGAYNNNFGINNCQSLVDCKKCGMKIPSEEFQVHLKQHKLNENFLENTKNKNTFNVNNHPKNQIINEDRNAMTGVINPNPEEFSKKNKSKKTNPSKKSTFICFKCGKEVPYKEKKDHNLEHDQEKLSHITQNLIEKGNKNPTENTKISKQNEKIKEIKNENKIESSKQNSSLICNVCGDEVEYKNLKNHNYKHKQDKKALTNKSNNEKSDDVSSRGAEKLPSQNQIFSINQQQQSSKSKNIENFQADEDKAKKVKTFPKPSTVECNKCGEEIAYKDLKEHNLLHKQKNINSKLSDAPAAVDLSKQIENSKPNISSTNKCEKPIQNNKFEVYNRNNKSLNPNEINIGNQDLINNIISIVTSKTNPNSNINIQFNINNSNKNDNHFNMSNGANSSENCDGIKIFENNHQALKIKIGSMEAELSKYSKEYKKLQNFIKTKIIDKDFKTSDIESEVKKLSELETLINETNGQINKLKEISIQSDDKSKNQENKMKKNCIQSDDKSKNQENKMNKNSEASVKKIEELEKQYMTLNGQKDDFSVEKLHSLERQLIKLKFEHAINYKSDVDYSVPSYWNQQSQNLVLFKLKENSKEFKQLSESFFSNLLNIKIKAITRIQNLELWKNFCFSKQLMTKKGQINTKFLLCGSKNKDPAFIYESSEEGFDMKLATPGILGTGIYFHESPCTVHPHSFTTGSLTHCLIIAEVLIGDTLNSKENRSLKIPPFKSEKNKIRFDSVRYEKDLIYAVYNNMRAYPAYLLEYQN